MIEVVVLVVKEGLTVSYKGGMEENAFCDVSEMMDLIRSGAAPSCGGGVVYGSGGVPVGRLVNNIVEKFQELQDAESQQALRELLAEPDPAVRFVAYCGLSGLSKALDLETAEELEKFRQDPENKNLVKSAAEKYGL